MGASGVISTLLASTIEPQNSVKNKNITKVTEQPLEPINEEKKPIKKPTRKPITDDLPTYKKNKVGRVRTDERVKREVFFYLFATDHFDRFLSTWMVNYYKRHYIKKDGRSHDKYLIWKKEYRQQYTSTERKDIPSKVATYQRTRTSGHDRRVLTFRERGN